MFAINKIILFQKWVYLLKKHVDILGKGNISILVSLNVYSSIISLKSNQVCIFDAIK